jgi:hypothetical protein
LVDTEPEDGEMDEGIFDFGLYHLERDEYFDDGEAPETDLSDR